MPLLSLSLWKLQNATEILSTLSLCNVKGRMTGQPKWPWAHGLTFFASASSSIKWGLEQHLSNKLDCGRHKPCEALRLAVVLLSAQQTLETTLILLLLPLFLRRACLHGRLWLQVAACTRSLTVALTGGPQEKQQWWRRRNEALTAHPRGALRSIKSFHSGCHSGLGIFVSLQLLFWEQTWRGNVFLYFKS